MRDRARSPRARGRARWLRVNPGLADQGLLMSGNDSATLQTRFEAEPRCAEPCDLRAGLGSVIARWLQTGSRLLPLRHLPRRPRVIVDLDSRRLGPDAAEPLRASTTKAVGRR